MNKIILLSFGTKNLIRSANRLRQQAKNFKIYDEILISNEDDIISNDKKIYKYIIYQRILRVMVIGFGSLF